jgi:hypothetical protein
VEEKHQINEELDEDMFYIKNKHICIDTYGVVYTKDKGKLYSLEDE